LTICLGERGAGGPVRVIDDGTLARRRVVFAIRKQARTVGEKEKRRETSFDIDRDANAPLSHSWSYKGRNIKENLSYLI